VHDAAIPLLEESVVGVGVGLLPKLDHPMMRCATTSLRDGSCQCGMPWEPA
jgi:hypothetical protein